MAFLDIFNKASKRDSINDYLGQICAHLNRIENKQKETSLQLEEIDDYLKSDGAQGILVNALIAVIDIIGDFYYYTAENKDSPLFEQAQMMWNTAKNNAQTTGLIIIDAVNEQFDFNLHSAKSTEYDINIINGYVIKTIKCGYIYKDEVLRRASVVVNKENFV